MKIRKEYGTDKYQLLIMKIYKKNIKYLFENIKYLLKYPLNDKENELIYKIKDETIDDFLFEYEEDLKLFHTLKILNEEETFNLLLETPKSFCRFGDGEINLICGKNQEFQSYNETLANRLMGILQNGKENLYVGLNRAYFHTPVTFAERNRKFYRIYGTTFRRFFIENCDPTKTYIDAGFLGAYFRFGEEYDFTKHYVLVKKMFEGKKICVVSGEGVLEKLKYDVFDNASEKIVIHAPAKNAFSSYDEILNNICNTVDKSYIICIILGMTAKVLVSDLADRGYIAWDVGHVAKDYDAYKKKLPKTQEVMDAFWAAD